MKLLRNGKNILKVNVEKTSSFGIWILVKGKEYFLSYEEYPFFKRRALKSVKNVKIIHGFHLYWPELDVDLSIDNLEHPEKYPLKIKKAI